MSENLTIAFFGIDWPFNGRIRSPKITAKADFIFAGLGDWEHLMYPSAWGITRCQDPRMDSITDLSLHGFSQVKGDIVGAAVGFRSYLLGWVNFYSVWGGSDPIARIQIFFEDT